MVVDHLRPRPIASGVCVSHTTGSGALSAVTRALLGHPDNPAEVALVLSGPMGSATEELALKHPELGCPRTATDPAEGAGSVDFCEGGVSRRSG